MLIETTSCPFCGNGVNTPCFAVYDDGYKCFTCGKWKKADRGFTPKDTTVEGVSYPKGIKNLTQFTYDAQKWLYTYHIDQHLISQWNITQLEDGKLIFPIIKDNECISWIERQISPKKIKHHGKKLPFLIRESRMGNSVVLVEDWISAIRVGQVTHCLCLFGLFLKSEYVSQLVKKYNNIYVWLDGDDRGQDAAKKLISQLDWHINKHNTKRAFDNKEKRVYNIYTKEDPKFYNEEEITREISK